MAQDDGYPAESSKISELVTKLAGAIAAISLIISLLFGVMMSESYYSSFGIPFHQTAVFDDYLRLAGKKKSQMRLFSLSNIHIASLQYRFIAT
ncbi:hypothetical protein WE348_23195 (plasmid) [Alteromonas macleodii]|uniref:hypothetical protein n=1 Tax=Alteromonas macleodii TaxID=28108 RepID=UPI0030D5D7D2